MSKLVLYSTLGCHLCDHAKEVLWPVLGELGVDLSEVDIADSEDLMAEYGTAIPVVEYPSNGSKLFWPFDQEQVRALLTPNT